MGETARSRLKLGSARRTDLAIFIRVDLRDSRAAPERQRTDVATTLPLRGFAASCEPKQASGPRTARACFQADDGRRGGARVGTSGARTRGGSGSCRGWNFPNKRGRRRWDGRGARGARGFGWCGR